MHFVMDSSGALHHRSPLLQEAFPTAVSLHELLATNSAAELLEIATGMRAEKKSVADIELFSIQQYAIWTSKVYCLDYPQHWLICVEVEQSTKTKKGNADLESLARKTEFYEALLQQLPAEVAVFDTDFKFLFVNQHAIKNEELRKWLIGRSEIEYWKSKDLPLDKALMRIQAFKEAVAEKKSTSVEEIFHAGTENEKHYMRITHPYFKDDALQFLLTYGIDITAVKKTELQLMRQNTELEKVNAELDQFVYSASHNLRAPLLSMKGLMGLISLEDTAFSDRNRFMNEVYKSIERLDATIHDIIEYSKNARLDVIPEEVDLHQIIADAREDLRFYEGKPITITCSERTTGIFYSDSRRIRSIVHNILSNSIKYADSEKEECWITIDIQLTRATCKATFSDNGIGISADALNRVFDMFYRGTSMRTGSGLGLYIVREMIQKLGGTIHLSSIEREGSSITIELPNLVY